MTSPKLGRYLVHFLAAQIVSNALLIAAEQVFQVTFNAGVSIGAALGCALYAAFMFVWREGRPPVRRETWKLAAYSMLLNWIVALFTMAAMFWTTTTEAERADILVAVQALPVWIWLAIAAVSSGVMVLLFASAYGPMARMFAKQIKAAS